MVSKTAVHLVYIIRALQSTFPECLKTAKVNPILKRADVNNPNNYKLVSILPVFSKILEKVMHLQIYTFVESENLLVDGQFAFRTALSTQDAILSLSNNITKCL